MSRHFSFGGYSITIVHMSRPMQKIVTLQYPFLLYNGPGGGGMTLGWGGGYLCHIDTFLVCRKSVI